MTHGRVNRQKAITDFFIQLPSSHDEGTEEDSLRGTRKVLLYVFIYLCMPVKGFYIQLQKL